MGVLKYVESVDVYGFMDIKNGVLIGFKYI